MAIGRITGPLLKANLLRDGVDLAFEDDLLYLDVNNGRVGIKASTPAGTLTNELTVGGTTRTINLIVDTQADIATFTLVGNTLSSTNNVINLEPSGPNPVVYQGKIITGDLQLSTNTIENTAVDTDLNINTLGTGKVNVNASMEVYGDLHATGTITADGDITFGSNSPEGEDNVIFNADIASNIIPDVTNTYDLGSDPLTIDPDTGEYGKEWRSLFTHEVVATNITANNFIANGIDLTLTQGNIYYVATNGSDANAGEHENNPFATVKHALSVATSGDTVYIYSGTYTEAFPLTVNAGVTVRGAGIRSVKIVPTTATRYNDAFLLNGDTTIEDLAVADFFSGGNFYTVTASSAGSTTVNVGTSPFAHTYVSGGTITIGASTYNITNADYTYTTGVLVLTHTGGTASLGQSVFVSNLTFSCAGAVGTSTRVFPDNGYAFRFAENLTVTSRSPYVRNVTVLTKGSVTSPTDPLGFESADAGKGAYIDGAYANSSSKEASMLFHSATFITPGVDTITAKNGVRVEWLNSFTYFANKGINAISSAYGFARQGQTRLRIDTRTGTWAVGNTVTYYDTDGTTVLGTGTIASVSGDYVNLTGKCIGFETITDRVGKTVYAQGDAKLSTTIKKFGASSLVLDGTGDYITVTSQPDFAFGTGDFCLEAWVYPTTTGTYRTLFDLRSSAGDTGGIILGISDINALYFYYNGNYRIGPVGAVTQNAWSHIALARVSGVTKAFINGTQVGSDYTDANNYAERGVRVGADPNGNYAFAGYIDDVRVSKGTGRYSSTFIPPTSALTGDLNTVLLLHFNGTNNSTTILDDGITYQDLRTNAGGTAQLINFADYSDFGAEIRAIGSANVYGNYGVYGDGDGVIAYLISQNFAYVGAGKLSNNDPNDRIAANEVTELNRAKIYYTSVDNEGNFSVGDSFYVNQKTGEVLFDSQALTITAPAGVTFTDGVNSTVITAADITTGNIRIHDNNVDSVTGEINVTAANGSINLQNNTYITGNLDVTGDITLGGNIQIGDQTTDSINFVGGINSNLIPATTATYNLGQGGLTPLRWNNVYLSRAEIDGLVIDSNNIGTTVGNDDLTLSAAGTGRIYVPDNNVQLDKNLTVGQDLTVVSGTTNLKNVGVTGTITQTGDINQTGTFTTSGNTDVTGNITASGYLQLPQILITGNTVSTRTAGTDLELQANGTGNVIVEGIKFQDNNIQSVATNSNITLTPQGTGNVVVNSNQSLVIPVGTTAERPGTGTESLGMIRYNTSLNRYEAWNGTYWIKLSGVQDVDGNTYITAESAPGANENVLSFYANNSLMATIDSTKLFAERFQTSSLDIQNNTITTVASNTDINFTTAGTGGVKIGNLRIRNNTITNVVSGAVTEFVETGTGYVKVAGTNGVVIPAGVDIERPSNAIAGMMRFNTEQSLVEVFNGVSWTSVAGTSSGVTFNEATEIGIGIVLTLG